MAYHRSLSKNYILHPKQQLFSTHMCIYPTLQFVGHACNAAIFMGLFGLGFESTVIELEKNKWINRQPRKKYWWSNDDHIVNNELSKKDFINGFRVCGVYMAKPVIVCAFPIISIVVCTARFSTYVKTGDENWIKILYQNFYHNQRIYSESELAHYRSWIEIMKCWQK